ncbi:hypothetical protein ACFL0X_00910 [Nanoarchaeota archaeon]
MNLLGRIKDGLLGYFQREPITQTIMLDVLSMSYEKRLRTLKKYEGQEVDVLNEHQGVSGRDIEGPFLRGKLSLEASFLPESYKIGDKKLNINDLHKLLVPHNPLFDLGD